MKKILLFSAALITLTACSKNAKRTLGITETMPDEYKVTKNRPLEVPPFYQGTSAPKKQKAAKQKLSKEEEALLKEAK